MEHFKLIKITYKPAVLRRDPQSSFGEPTLSEIPQWLIAPHLEEKPMADAILKALKHRLMERPLASTAK